MEKFYLIVVSIAIVLLILFFTFIGLLLRRQTSTEIFPPNKNSCPDFWTNDSSGNCYIPTQASFGNPTTLLNMGGLASLGSSVFAPYSTDGKSFNSTNVLWSSGGESIVCAQKKWANNNNIIWDGISNFNKC